MKPALPCPAACEDETPRLHETAQTVTLHFGGEALQSQMRKSDPCALEFEYTRLMMGFMIFRPTPANILQVGLGGGSLAKFCARYLADSQITTLEISPKVIALREHFLIPADSAQFRIVETDAAVYLAAAAADSQNILLIDGYDAHGIPEALCSAEFHADCWRVLRSDGVLVSNLWKRDAHYRQILTHLHRLFGRRVLSLPCDTGNEVVIAFREEALPDFEIAWQQARHAQQHTGIDFPRMLENMVFSARGHWFYHWI